MKMRFLLLIILTIILEAEANTVCKESLNKSMEIYSNQDKLKSYADLKSMVVSLQENIEHCYSETNSKTFKKLLQKSYQDFQLVIDIINQRNKVTRGSLIALGESFFSNKDSSSDFGKEITKSMLKGGYYNAKTKESMDNATKSFKTAWLYFSETLKLNSLITNTNSSNKWITPSKRAFIDNGGRIDKNGISFARISDIYRICRAMDASVPTYYELQEALTSCGGVLGETSKNRKNYSYQSCRKNKGFLGRYYLSSTTYPDGKFIGILGFHNGKGDSAKISRNGYGNLLCIKNK